MSWIVGVKQTEKSQDTLAQAMVTAASWVWEDDGPVTIHNTGDDTIEIKLWVINGVTMMKATRPRVAANNVPVDELFMQLLKEHEEYTR